MSTKLKIIIAIVVGLVLLTAGVSAYFLISQNENINNTLVKNDREGGCLKENEYADYSVNKDNPDDGIAKVYIKDKEDDTIISELSFDDVFTNHSIKIRDCHFYAIRNLNYDEVNRRALDNYKSEIWKYDYNQNGELILLLSEMVDGEYVNYGYDFYFHISPDEKYIVLKKDILDNDKYSIVFKDIESGHDVYSIKHKDILLDYPDVLSGDLNVIRWVDNNTIWIAMSNHTLDTAYLRINRDPWRYEVFQPPSNLTYNSNAVINDNGYIAYSDLNIWTAGPDIEELINQAKQDDKRNNLFIYNLISEEIIKVDSIEPGHNYNMNWVSDTELEYELPDGTKKIYTISGDNQSNSKKILEPLTLDVDWRPYKNEVYGYSFDIPKETRNSSNISDETSFYISSGKYDSEEYSVMFANAFVTDKPFTDMSLKAWLISDYDENIIKKIIFTEQPNLEAYILKWRGRTEIFTEYNDLLYVAHLKGEGINGEELINIAVDKLEQSFYINKIDNPENLTGDNVDWSYEEEKDSVFYSKFYSGKEFRYEIKSKIIGKISKGKYMGGGILEIYVISLDDTDDYDGKWVTGDVWRHTPPPFRAVLTDDYGIITQDLINNVHNIKPDFDRLLDSLGLVYKEDASIKILSYFSNIYLESPRQLLRLQHHAIGKRLDNKVMEIVGNTPVGELYTDINKIQKPLFFYDDSFRNSTTFPENGFYIFLPESDYLTYIAPPDFNIGEILLMEGKIEKLSDRNYAPALYTSRTKLGCSGEYADWVAVLSPASTNNGKDLIPVTKNPFGDSVYALSSNHQIVKDFYEAYKKYRMDTVADYIPPLYSFEEFIASYPILIWEDPFDRFIRFVRTDFIPPFACEPIIYLYPEEQQEVSIEIDPKVTVFNSEPKYINGWNVVANPDGIIELEGRQYPYLFWEGFSDIFSINNNGFVIERDEVKSFLKDKLKKMGLIDKEIEDFLEAWMPHFEKNPYYFITFYEQEFIESIYPIKITPEPDTVIRILMDFMPLDKPISVDSIEIKTPERGGFTVVEWGGLIR